MNELNLILPYPPSANTAWRQGNGKIYLNKKVINYRHTVKMLTFMCNRFHDSLIALEIKAFPPDKRRRDIDNLIKQIFDSLQYAKIFNDDFQIKKLFIEMLEVKKLGEIQVKIRDIL